MDIQKICDAAGIPFSTLAREIFPSHGYPEHALKYLGKKGKVTPYQVSIIERLSGMSMEALEGRLASDMPPLTGGWSWRPSAEKSSFLRGSYRVDYHPNLNTAYLYNNGELVSDHILVSGTVTMKQFTTDMEKLIASYEATKTR